MPVKRSSNMARKKLKRMHCSVEEDYISKLPDDILVSIISLLNLKEAKRTSILSRRWRNLWKFTSRLDFDESQLMSNMRARQVMKSLQVERYRFIGKVNNVLKSHQAGVIDEFTVCFDVDEGSCKCHIDSWINFALEKRVRKLHLDFRRSRGYYHSGQYTLTSQFLSSYNLDSLTVLHLKAVEVSSEVVEDVVSRCQFLKVLCVDASHSLVRLKVSGLELKCLEITQCQSLKHVEISATNLASLKYEGPKINMNLGNLPHLVELSVAGPHAKFFHKNIYHFSSYLCRLETLNLCFLCESIKSIPRFRFPNLRKLQQVELIVNGFGVRTLLHCTSLLKMSPLLQKFTVQIEGLKGFQKHKRVLLKAKPHRCLKVIELSGFIGCEIDVELVQHLLQSSPSLEKLVIDTRQMSLDGPLDVLNRKQKLAATTCAKQLQSSLPPGAELVIM